VVPNKKNTKKLPRRERRSGKGKIRRQKQCKDPSNQCNHCNIDGHTKEKCWKLHLEMIPKNHKKGTKKKNLLLDSSNQIKSILNVDEKIVYALMQEEVNLSSLHHKEEKEMTNLFQVIRDYPASTTMIELHSFSSLTNFYHMFMWGSII
jgi:hypothetical protein